MAWSSPFFFRAPAAVLMGADDGGVDHHVFGVGVTGQVIQNTLENPAMHHRLKRWCVLFQEPKCAGKSRHGTPVR